VANPKTGTVRPIIAYTRQMRCRTLTVARAVVVGSAAARRAAAGNMLAATVTGPIATIAARTWTVRKNLAISRHRFQEYGW
jgi:hypothetical protein